MRAADVVVSAFLALVGSVVLYDAARLGFRWGLEGPQSGFFPFSLALGLVVVALAVLIQTLRRRTDKPFATLERFRPVLKVLLPVAGFIVVTDPPGRLTGLGLYVASAFYLAFYMRWVGRHDWRAVVALSIAVPVIAFFVFEKWFLVPMPKGPLEDWLGY